MIPLRLPSIISQTALWVPAVLEYITDEQETTQDPDAPIIAVTDGLPDKATSEVDEVDIVVAEKADAA